MGLLQQIDQGTAEANGSDGDTVRSAFTKVNANMTALGSQIVYASGPTLATPTTLDNTVIGKRVIINFSSTGAVTLPKASTCPFDGVIQLVNISAVVVNLPTASGDTGPSFSLAPGESTTVFTDGVKTWTASERNRSASANEFVAGNLSVGSKLCAVNSPNILFNGSGEFGVLGGWGPGGFVGAYNYSPSDGTILANSSSVSGNVYAGSTPIPITPNLPLTLSGEMYTAGITAGYSLLRLVFLNSSQTVLSTSPSISVPSGVGWSYGSVTVQTPPNTAYVYVQIAVENLSGSVVAGAGGAAWRRMKLEKGSVPSLYSQEASIAYLQTAQLGAGASAYSLVTSNRVVGTTYTNSTSRPLFVTAEVMIPAFSGTFVYAQMIVNGVEVGAFTNSSSAAGIYGNVHAVVPPGATYQVGQNGGTVTLSRWNEY